MSNRARKRIIKGDDYLSLSSLRYLPRWIVFLIDILILIVSLFVCYFVISHITNKIPAFLPIEWRYIIIVSVNVLMMYLFKTFSGIIRHSTFIDVQKIFWSSLATLGILLFFKYSVLSISGIRVLFTPLLLLYFFVSFMSLLLFRLVVKQSFNFIKQIKSSVNKKRLLILGISDHCVAIANAI